MALIQVDTLKDFVNRTLVLLLSFFVRLMCSGSDHFTESYAIMLCLERGPYARGNPERVLHSTCAQQEACGEGDNSVYFCLALLLKNEE